MLSANNLAIDSKLLGKSLIQIKNRRGPKTDLCGIPVDMGNQSEI